MSMTNYTGFARIDIGGKERPFYYGIASADIYCQQEGVEFHVYQEHVKLAFGYTKKDETGKETETVKANPIYTAKLFASCLFAGYEFVEEEPDFKPSRVKFWLQELPEASMNKIIDVIIGANKSPNESAPVQTEQTA